MSQPLRALRSNLREAARSLSRARLRTLLGLVGIMIGIASVIAMLSAGEIATAESRKRFEALGTDVVTIAVRGSRKGPGIDLGHAVELADSVPAIEEAAPVVSAGGSFMHAGKPVGHGNVQGVTASFAALNKLQLAAGRFVSDLDVGRFWCVVGAEVASAMRRRGTRGVVGAAIEVKERIFTVVGELRDTPENYGLPFRVNANRSVFIPITTAKRLDPESSIRLVIARSRPDVHHEDAERQVADWFRAKARNLRLDVTSAKQLIAQMESQLGLMTLLLGAVGSIALVVGGIGVMNIMLISVSERRREIGVRRALGAQRTDIQRQFLIESVILTVAGGIAGTMFGTGATYAICRFTGWEFQVSTTSIVVGLVVSSVVGVFFGYQPARQAARLDPIAALQGE